MSLAAKVVLLLEYLLLIGALRIILNSSVARLIFAYRVQCVLLAFAVGITAWGKLTDPGGLSVAQPDALISAVELIFILILPMALLVFVGPLLRSATAWEADSDSSSAHGGEPAEDKSDSGQETTLDTAKRLWRDASEHAIDYRVWDVAIFVVIVILASLIAMLFSFKDPSETVGLTVSLTLHLIGLYMIVSKQDLISQTVGLLVMDHGLYLAIVRVVALPAPGLYFVIGLWFYTAITLFILLFLVPQIRRVAQGIDLDKIARESDLKG